MSDAHTLQEEDGFHEIQLNGKQLVFLGMTTTLVSVVIFLCGVLVGRGVKPVEPVAEAATVQTASADPVATTPAPEPPPPAPEPTPAAAAAPPTPAADKADTDKAETEKTDIAKAEAPKAEAPAPAPPPAPAPAPKAEPKAAAPAPTAVAKAAEPTPVPEEPAAAPAAAPARSGGAIAVQVAALTSRSDAEAIARRLSGKGYAAYILSPDAGAKQVYKVRVGNYASADEAARVSRRLRQEEKLQPWVIR
jgi:hypothetical protein